VKPQGLLTGQTGKLQHRQSAKKYQPYHLEFFHRSLHICGSGNSARGAPMTVDGENARRPIAARSSAWAVALSGRLADWGVSPNTISILSVLFAALGGTVIYFAESWLARLICNLLDGMVAIEGGRKTKSGAIYNEFPDRVADTLFLVPLGYACGMPWLGWACALLAALTAYVRVFGGALGLVQDFGGVMAKQRRMAALTIGLVVQAVAAFFVDVCWPLLATATIIAIGSLVTCVTRTIAIARKLEQS
jgi:phosphatidylglycerophosphate synthase